MSSWKLLLILPNLAINGSTPFEFNSICICSGNDPRISVMEPWKYGETSRKLLARFKTLRGDSYMPSCILIKAKLPLHAEAVRAFRNVCAVATTTSGVARAMLDRGQWQPLYSDFFTFGHYVPRVDGLISTLEGPSEGIDEITDRFTYQSDPRLSNPTRYFVRPDKTLLSRLMTAWAACYLRGVNRTPMRRLFRSLEVAFQAGYYASDGLLGVHDIGTRLGLWVSAFEILMHPGGNGVNKRVIQDRFLNMPWENSALKARLFKAMYKGEHYRVNLPGDIYSQLYDARNRFFHGESVTISTVFYRQSRRYHPLRFLAPLIYNAALRNFVDSWFPSQKTSRPPKGSPLSRWWKTKAGQQYIASSVEAHIGGLKDIEEALLAARNPRRVR